MSNWLISDTTGITISNTGGWTTGTASTTDTWVYIDPGQTRSSVKRKPNLPSARFPFSKGISQSLLDALQSDFDSYTRDIMKEIFN